MSIQDEISFKDSDKQEFILYLEDTIKYLKAGNTNLEWFVTSSYSGGYTDISFCVDEKVQNGTKQGPEGV